MTNLPSNPPHSIFYVNHPENNSSRLFEVLSEDVRFIEELEYDLQQIPLEMITPRSRKKPTIPPTSETINRSQRPLMFRKFLNNKIFVGLLNENVTNTELHRAFETEVGGVLNAFVVRRKDGNRESRGFGFVEFEDHHQFLRALTKNYKMTINGRALRILEARTDSPNYTDSNTFNEKQKERVVSFAGNPNALQVSRYRMKYSSHPQQQMPVVNDQRFSSFTISEKRITYNDDGDDGGVRYTEPPTIPTPVLTPAHFIYPNRSESRMRSKRSLEGGYNNEYHHYEPNDKRYKTSSSEITHHIPVIEENPYKRLPLYKVYRGENDKQRKRQHWIDDRHIFNRRHDHYY